MVKNYKLCDGEGQQLLKKNRGVSPSQLTESNYRRRDWNGERCTAQGAG